MFHLAYEVWHMVTEIIEAHGGQRLWDQVGGLKIQLRVGGAIMATKVKSPLPRSILLEVAAARIHACLSPFPGAGLRGVFDEHSVRIETEAGVVVKERIIERDADCKVERRFVWDDLDLLYFLGYALWNYSVTPFYFTWPSFECLDGGLWREKDGSHWRTLRVTYPPAFPTHSRRQIFYFDERGLLQRLDYTAHVFGEYTRGAHYCSDHRIFDGLVFPTHRVVYPRLPSGRPFKLFRAMEGWVDDVEVVWKHKPTEVGDVALHIK
jgi:hypothetical protein